MRQQLLFKAYTFTTHKDVSVSEIVSRSQRSIHCNESYVERREEEQLLFRQDSQRYLLTIFSSQIVWTYCGSSRRRFGGSKEGNNRR